MTDCMNVRGECLETWWEQIRTKKVRLLRICGRWVVTTASLVISWRFHQRFWAKTKLAADLSSHPTVRSWSHEDTGGGNCLLASYFVNLPTCPNHNNQSEGSQWGSDHQLWSELVKGRGQTALFENLRLSPVVMSCRRYKLEIQSSTFSSQHHGLGHGGRLNTPLEKLQLLPLLSLSLSLLRITSSAPLYPPALPPPPLPIQASKKVAINWNET